jgi:hypothetical protein
MKSHKSNLPFSAYRTKFPKALETFFDDKWVILRTPEDGNCGPNSVRLALEQAPGYGSMTVADVRAVVAKSITEENLYGWQRKLRAYPIETEDTDAINEIAENAITAEQISKAVAFDGYYLDNDDLSVVGAQLGVYVMYVNQLYDPVRSQKQIDNIADDLRRNRKARSYTYSSVLLNTLIMCQPHIGAERSFLQAILANEDPDVMLLYNRSDKQHYELLMQLEEPRTIMPYSSLPAGVRAFVQRACVEQLDQGVADMTEAEQLAAALQLSLQDLRPSQRSNSMELERKEQEHDNAVDELLMDDERGGASALAAKDREWQSRRNQEMEDAQLERDLEAIAHSERNAVEPNYQAERTEADKKKKKKKKKKSEKQKTDKQKTDKNFLRKRKQRIIASPSADEQAKSVSMEDKKRVRTLERTIMEDEEEEEEEEDQKEDDGDRESQDWTEDDMDMTASFDCLSFDTDLPVTWMLRCPSGSGKWIQLPHRLKYLHRSECFNFAQYVYRRTGSSATNMHVVQHMERGHVYLYADTDCELRARSWRFMSSGERAHLAKFLPPVYSQEIQTDWADGPNMISIAQV